MKNLKSFSMNRSFLKNAFGMTLVEVMMAVAISGGLALTIAKMMENSSQSVKQVEAKSESIALKNIIQNTLSNTDACKFTFTPLITQANLTNLTASPTNSVTVPGIKDKTNTTVYSTATTTIKPLTITSIVLTNYNSAAGTGDMVIQSTFRRSATQIQPVKAIRIALNFNINNSVPTAPVLNTCSSSAVDSGAGWELTGNAGTVDGTDFIGTTDNQPINFRVNNVEAGRIDSVSQTLLGYEAGFSLTTGSANTIIGHQAMRANETGLANTVIGRQAAIISTAGAYNSIIGFRAASALTTGQQNVIIGSSAGNSITAGQNNIAIGPGAGANVFAGSNSILIGAAAGATYAAAGNKLAIEGIAGNTPLIGGDFSARTVTIDGSLAIGTTTPGTPNSVMPTPATPVKMHIRGAVIIDQTPWLDVTMSASASSGTGSWMKCRVDTAGNVHIKGYINKIATSTSSSNQSLGTLPLDCRPRSAADGTSAASAHRVGNAFDHADGTKYCFHISGAPGDAYWDGRLQATACDSTQGTTWGGSAFDQTWWPLARTMYIPEIIFSKLQ